MVRKLNKTQNTKIAKQWQKKNISINKIYDITRKG